MSLIRKLLSPPRVQRNSGVPIQYDDWAMQMYGMSTRPVNGQERPVVTDYMTAADRILKRNGPIAALMFLRSQIFSEARFQFQSMDGGRPGKLFGTTELLQLEEPWTNATTGDLLARMIQDADLAGNSFWTNRNGRLKRLRPDWVTIVTGSHDDPALFGDAIDGEIIGYIYDPQAPGSGDGEVLLPDEVAHFAPLPDPMFQFRGMSWLTPVIREIEADSAATEHKLSFFRNGATPQTIVTVDPSMEIEKFKKFSALFDEKYGGVNNAYRTIIMGGGADVKVVGTDLRQLDFKATQGAGETRLAALAGIPPVIVGFSEGMQGSSLNAGNYAAARRRAADGTFRPLWRNAAGSLASIVNVPSGSRLWYDDRDIAFLREDRKDAAEIQQTQAATIRQYIDAGFIPDTAVSAVMGENPALLKHSGLYSVQLQPANSTTTPPAIPGTVAPPTNPKALEAPKTPPAEETA